ncbi:MAG: Fic family protein [Bryobacterales bacterium]|nr:Fic family protein [Bryobacterales bacterium]
MGDHSQPCFSGAVTVFREQMLPERAVPAGYAALIDAFGLRVPWPRTLWGIGEHHRVRTAPGWRLLTPRHAPAPTLEGRLTFALKYEGLDLAVLKRLFTATGPKPVEALVRAKPKGSYARRLWFLYEWLMGERLDLADAGKSDYVPVVDEEQQWAVRGQPSPRHRVRNNLPGTPAFCPLVFRTKLLEEFASMDLAARAQSVVAAVPHDLLARTAAFLLLKDSRSSYAIEGERAPQDRIQRWGRAIGEAGRRAVTLEELLRLQRIVIGDARFVRLGLRREGGFAGEHDRESRLPLPDHISAVPADLTSLIEGMAAFDSSYAPELDGVIAAAALAFGFVYAHPFVDGNGRVHRYLIHHVLARHGYSPAGVVFPVSAAILERVEEYRAVLEDYSKRLLPVIQWEPTPDGNVRVLEETGDFYRYFDATPHAEFLYTCVRKTIEEDLPREAEFRRRYDRFRERITRIVDMPAATMDLLFGFLQQNGGRLSGRARAKEFRALTEGETAAVEEAYADQFGG